MSNTRLHLHSFAHYISNQILVTSAIHTDIFDAALPFSDVQGVIRFVQTAGDRFAQQLRIKNRRRDNTQFQELLAYVTETTVTRRGVQTRVPTIILNVETNQGRRELAEWYVFGLNESEVELLQRQLQRMSFEWSEHAIESRFDVEHSFANPY